MFLCLSMFSAISEQATGTKALSCARRRLPSGPSDTTMRLVPMSSPIAVVLTSDASVFCAVGVWFFSSIFYLLGGCLFFYRDGLLKDCPAGLTWRQGAAASSFDLQCVCLSGSGERGFQKFRRVGR